MSERGLAIFLNDSSAQYALLGTLAELCFLLNKKLYHRHSTFNLIFHIYTFARSD